MDEAELNSLVVKAVLKALPVRWVPSRSFLTASVQIVQSLVDAWLAVQSSSEFQDLKQARSLYLPLLASLVGDACATAWWQDAEEFQVPTSAPRRELLQAIATILGRGRSLPGNEAGGAWVCCALEDLVGSTVVALTAKATPRPTTGRPPSRQRPPTSDFRPPSRVGGATGTKFQQGMDRLDRFKLLGIKHFVTAAKADPDLQNCPLVATCLADVATGLAPYLEVEFLLGSVAYRDRLVAWASQEGQGQEGPGFQEAISQAMKVSSASVAGQPGPLRQTGPLRLAQRKVSQEKPGPSAESTDRRSGRRSSWLPQAFVQSFNAEGEEVEGVEGVEDEGAADHVPKPESDCAKRDYIGRSTFVDLMGNGFGHAERAFVQSATSISCGLWVCSSLPGGQKQI
ncbi:unnamed protein product [Durusdinium trenchii]|uniref:Uncharacterized protein n=1 Tax=Durusdinium trenchii TaxID=1381693 RepID=A0ABP0HHI7_9DINO